MPIPTDYADALICEEIARTRAMVGLVPYPLKIGALEGLAERCTYVLKEGASTLESLRTDVRSGGDVGAVMEGVSLCITSILDIEEYGLPPLQCQTNEMALLNVVLRRLHDEMSLPFPRPTACCISNQHYASHIPTNTIYTPIGESRSIQHFPHLYHELGHYLFYALEDPRLMPLREGFKQAAATVNAHYTGLEQDGTETHNRPHTKGFATQVRAQWTEWLIEAL